MEPLNKNLIADICPLISNADQEDKVQGLLNAILIRTNFLSVKRQQLGWMGLKYSCKSGESWTCKIKGMDGIYGFCPGIEHDEYGHYLASWDLYYFPAENDKYFESYALETAAMICEDDYVYMQRDFLCYNDFKKRFKIGQLSLEVSKSLDNIVLTQHAPVQIVTTSVNGVRAKVDGESVDIIKKGGIDQNLPAFEISTAFFNVLADTLSFNLKSQPSLAEEYIFSFNDTSVGKAVRLCFGEGWPKDVFMAERGVAYNLSRSMHACNEKPEGDGKAWWKSEEKQEAGPREVKVNANKPELIILTGYLGAGKTSFIKKLIEYHVTNRRFVAVIQNEIGETGLDAKMLEDDYAVLEMDEGCVCCSLVGQLRKGIRQLTKDHNPEVIILETTGLANPFNLLDEIEEVKDIVTLGPITTIIDAFNFRITSQMSPLVNQQLLAADIVLINKTDLLDTEEMEILENELQRLNPGARYFNASYGDINPGILYQENASSIDVAGLSNTERYHHHDHMDEGVGSIKLEMTDAISRKEFLLFIDSIKDLAYRIKGLINFTGEPGQYVFQYVNGQYEIQGPETESESEYYIICIGTKKELSQINNIFLNHKKQLS